MIKPYVCSKIYESSNPIKCAKKYYSQLKSEGKSFTIFQLIDLDSNKIFTFKNSKQYGGDPIDVLKITEKTELEKKELEKEPEKKPELEKPEQVTNIQTDTRIQEKIAKIESRLDKLEEKNTGFISPPKDTEACTLM